MRRSPLTRLDAFRQWWAAPRLSPAGPADERALAVTSRRLYSALAKARAAGNRTRCLAVLTSLSTVQLLRYELYRR